MNKKRLKLHQMLCDIIKNPKRVYFVTPEGFKMEYPCFKYELSSIDTNDADNKKYIKKYTFKIMYISKTIDSDILDNVLNFEGCQYLDYFISDGLHHNVYKITL